MELPGKLGYSLVGDESIEFVRSPRTFIEKRRKSHGSVFQGRVINKPHVFLTSNSSVQELLIEKWKSFSMGYKEFVGGLFDENLTFLEGDSWNNMRSTLERVFSRESAMKSVEETKHIIDEYMKQLETSKPIVVYEMFKELATRLSIALFLSHDIGKEDAREISELMTTHWRGIISVPLPIRVPFYGWRSGYSKALTAKDRLLSIIVERLTPSPSNIAAGIDESCGDRESVAGHLLLFISALIPKAVASLLTSAVIELSKPENVRWKESVGDNERADDIILEIQRLWPPFFGGRRVCTEECEIGGYRIPEGYSAVYVSFSANRDSAVFPQAESFRPDRWTQENFTDKDKVWTFGGGPRQCIGRFLSSMLLRECLQQFVKGYSWELVPGQDLTYKTLPVSRPKQDITVVLTQRTHSLRDAQGQ